MIRNNRCKWCLTNIYENYTVLISLINIFLYFQVCCLQKKRVGRGSWRKVSLLLTPPVSQGSHARPTGSLESLSESRWGSPRSPVRSVRCPARTWESEQPPGPWCPPVLSTRGRGATWRPSQAQSRSPCRICRSGGSTCSDMPSSPMTGPTDVLNARRSRYLRASRTNTASSDTRSFITRALHVKCFPAPSVLRSSRGQTKWSSTWNKCMTASFPKRRLVLPLRQTLSSIPSWTSATRWTTRRPSWRTPTPTCSSWSARWPATPPTSRARVARGPAD